MNKLLFQRAVGISSAAVLLVPPAFAADVTWDNPGSGAFTVGTNWNTDVVPGNTDNAIIANGGTATIGIGDTAEVSRLIVDNGSVTQTGGSTSTVPFGNFESPGAYAIGSASGQTGSYTISGASALTGGRMRIGYSGGNGSVSIGNTSTYNGASGQDTWVGNGAGSVGSLTITDSAQWNILNDWFVAGRTGGQATVTMSGSTQLGLTGGGNIIFGTDGGSVTTANISGSANVFTQGGEIWVGNGGANGTLNLSGGATMTAQNHWIAVGRSGGTGMATISGTAQLKKEGATGDRHFIVGDGTGSNGTLVVKDSALVSSNQGLRVGANGGAVGVLTVQDTATVDVGGELWLGNNGNGTVNLQGGTINVGNWVAIGRDGTSTGTLNISGGTFNKNGATNTNFIVNGATGTVTQTGGALNVNAGQTWLSEGGGKNTTWTATGGTANLGGETRIGMGSAATMTIGGTANYTNQNVIVGSGAAGVGTLNLNGGTFLANSITEGAGSGSVNFNGGLVRARAASGDFLAGFENADLNVQIGGLVFDTNSHNVTITQALAGAGGLAKLGAGELTLSSLAVAYEGDTVVEGGTLTINTTFLTDDSDVYLTAGSVFNLNFDATDTIRMLFIDGVAMSAGVWGSLASSADFKTSLITGDGLLLVTVPEPAHYAMGMVILLGLTIVMRRRRRQA